MIRIVVLDKSFVSVGKYSQGPDWCSLDDAYVIRYWGTTKGLGEIAENGPTSKTVLDKTPKQHFPVKSIIKTIDCNADNWSKWIK
jgi:hypothetical protein